MTRGISEERLLEIRNTCDARDRYAIDLILKECTELNPWMPIETSPLGKRIRLFDGKCQVEGRLYEEIDRKIFTHWCELPDDPH